MEEKLLATEIDFLRRSARKLKLYRFPNEQIRKLTNKEKTIIDELQSSAAE